MVPFMRKTYMNPLDTYFFYEIFRLPGKFNLWAPRTSHLNLMKVQASGFADTDRFQKSLLGCKPCGKTGGGVNPLHAVCHLPRGENPVQKSFSMPLMENAYPFNIDDVNTDACNHSNPSLRLEI